VKSTAHDQVQAAGAPMGVTYVPWKAVGLSIGKKF